MLGAVICNNTAFNGTGGEWYHCIILAKLLPVISFHLRKFDMDDIFRGGFRFFYFYIPGCKWISLHGPEVSRVA
jgi:hypothetical protein